MRTCGHCGQPFTSRQPNAFFCGKACKIAAHNLEKTRGQQLYRAAMAWRAGKGGSFSDLTWLIDSFRREDREAGRPPPPVGRLDHHTVATARLTYGHMRRLKKQGELQT